MNELLEKFTSHLKTVLTRALCLAVEKGGDTISPVHLLWALGTEEGCIGAEILKKSGITPAILHHLVGIQESGLPETALLHASKITPLLSEDAKTIIEKAVHAAGTHGHRYVGTEHLLYGILEGKAPTLTLFFQENTISETVIRDNLAIVFKTTAHFPELPKILPEKSLSSNKKPCDDCGQIHDDDEHEGENKDSALGYFTVELTTKVVADTIDPVIGRQEEINRVITVLSRRTKNNPLLLGEPGVGKTAIAEGLAKRIMEGSVPDAIAHVHVHRLDMASLVAGTMYRGDFEARVTQLLEELKNRKDIVLFIDEIHTLVGAGAASGSLDAANMLKPALARGEIRCIGATTQTEYKKHIAADAALERRFAAIPVHEPTAQETLAVLKGLRTRYEKHHHVSFTDAALATIIRVSERYLTHKQFPDKAIDLLDEAGAYANVGRKTRHHYGQKLRALETELEHVQEAKIAAVTAERFPDAVTLKEREAELQKSIQILKKNPTKHSLITIDEATVLTVASHITRIPLKRLTTSDHDALRSLEKRLKRHILAQDTTVERVAQAIQRAKLGFTKPRRPLASFLFAGPSGVGKTALAKALAREMFGDESALIRFDMSEFSEGFSVSKLVGAPAGYVGYRESAKLLDSLRERPHSVVLFDELEKAHRDVQALLLQILDEGSLTDATGNKVNFENSIIIMTTNVGRERFEKTALGFTKDTDRTALLHEDLRVNFEEHFRPELVNRIDHLCIFNSLEKKDMIAITQKALSELTARLANAQLTITLPKNLAESLVQYVKPKHGARDIHRVIEEKLEHRLAQTVLARKKTKTRLRVSFDKHGAITIQ